MSKIRSGEKIQTYRLSLKRDRVLRVAETKAGDASAIARIAHAMLADSPVERVIAVLLGAQNEVLGIVDLASTASISTCAVDARGVYKAALAGNASAIILAHNHPSGNPTPSSDDITMTKRLATVGQLIGITLLDHIIVTREPGKFFSMLDRGMMGEVDSL